MKSKDFSRIAKLLLSVLPCASIKGSMMFLRPVNYSLRGLYFEGSSFDSKSFYIWVFFLPIFVPTKYLYFNFGKRLRSPDGSDRWNSDEPNLIEVLGTAIKQEALPFLNGVETPKEMLASLSSLDLAQDPYVKQATAYILVQLGNVDHALNCLNDILKLLDLNVPWQKEIAERAEILINKLLENPEDAKHQLDNWGAESLKSLGVS